MSAHVFASVRPSAGALRTLYAVPSGKRFTGRVIITNCGEGLSSIKVTVAPGGVADAPTQAVIDDMLVAGNEAISTAPLMLSANDVIRGLSLNGETNFHVTGLLQDL